MLNKENKLNIEELKISKAELEQVTGGDAMADDSRFLNVLLRGREGHCDRYGAWTVIDHYDEVVRAWASVGVEFYCDEEGAYYWLIDGKYVPQYRAWLRAEQVVGKHLTRSDWDW